MGANSGRSRDRSHGRERSPGGGERPEAVANPSRPERAEHAPRRERPRREDHAPVAERSVPLQAARSPDPARSANRPAAREDREERVIGLGDHVPSFLLRPTRAPRRHVEAED